MNQATRNGLIIETQELGALASGYAREDYDNGHFPYVASTQWAAEHHYKTAREELGLTERDQVFA
jgi:hypothetical protein